MKIKKIIAFFLLMTICVKPSSSSAMTSAQLGREIISGANDLASLVQKIQSTVNSAAYNEISNLIAKLNQHMDQLTVDEEAMTRDALTHMRVAQGKIVSVRITLRELARETVKRTNILKRILARITPGTRDATLFNRLRALQRTFAGLMTRSKRLLHDSNWLMNESLDKISYTVGRIEAFVISVSTLSDRESSRYQGAINKLRAEAYGGSSACVVVAVSCPFIYSIVAPIIETKISDFHKSVAALQSTCNDAKSKAMTLKRKVETSISQTNEELAIVAKWEGAVDLTYTMTDSMDSLNIWIEGDLTDEVVSALDSLKDVCNEYLEVTKKSYLICKL